MLVSADAVPRALSSPLLGRAADWPPSRWFLAVGIPFGVAFALVTPPLQTPDELPHLARAFAISEGTLGAEAIVDGRPSVRSPRSLVALPTRLGRGLQMHSERRQDPARIERELARSPDLDDRLWRPLPSLYSPVPYLPQAAGVGVARALGLPVVAFAYAARLGNLAAFLALTWLALRATPAHATSLLVVALLPMTLFIAASVTADALTNALAFAWMGLVLRASCAGPRLPPREILALGAVAAGLGLAKPGYALLTALALAVPAARFAGRWQRAGVLAGWVAAALVPALLWSAYLTTLAPDPLVPQSDPASQLRWMAGHPGEFAAVLLATLASMRRIWVASFVGVLGHADTWLPRWLYTLQPLLLLAAGIADGGAASPLRGWRRALALATALGTALATLALAYLMWNAVGDRYVQGVQGRYFTPFAPLALAVLHVSRGRGLVGTARLPFVALAVLALAVALERVASRYYGPPA